MLGNMSEGISDSGDLAPYIPTDCVTTMGSSRFVPPPPPPLPSLVGAYYLHHSELRAIFLHNDLLCNDPSFVTGGGRITYWGAQTGKIPTMNKKFLWSTEFSSKYLLKNIQHRKFLLEKIKHINFPIKKFIITDVR